MNVLSNRIEFDSIIHSPRPTLPPRAYSMLLRDSPTHKTPSPDHAPTNPSVLYGMTDDYSF